MKNIEQIKKDIFNHIKLYFDGKLQAKELVSYIDSYYFDEIDETLLNQSFIVKLNELRDELAYFEPIDKFRKEDMSYFGEEKLKEILNKFIVIS